MTAPDADEFVPIPAGPVMAVVAHPDDESFGLGALLAMFANQGRPVSVLCFTHGEASTVGAAADLGEVRRRELRDAAAVLGIEQVTLLDLPDGALHTYAEGELDAHIEAWFDATTAAFVVFEPQGVTGHTDHRAVTAAAERIADRRKLPVVEWGIDPTTADQLQQQHGARFRAIADGPAVVDVAVDREGQLAAIRCHRSQLDDGAIVFKRLALQGNIERIRVRRPRDRAAPEVP